MRNWRQVSTRSSRGRHFVRVVCVLSTVKCSVVRHKFFCFMDLRRFLRSSADFESVDW